MKKQTITLEVTVPDDASNPDEVILSILEEAELSLAGGGYSWWMTDSSEVTETNRLVGPYAWHRTFISIAGQPAKSASDARAALEFVGGAGAVGALEDPSEGEDEPGFWMLMLPTNDPLVEHVVTQVESPSGTIRIEVPEL
jgi:hypothetical protein